MELSEPFIPQKATFHMHRSFNFPIGLVTSLEGVTFGTRSCVYRLASGHPKVKLGGEQQTVVFPQ